MFDDFDNIDFDSIPASWWQARGIIPPHYANEPAQAKQDKQELHSHVVNMFEDGWNKGGDQVFIEFGEMLLDIGMPLERVVNYLDTLFNAVRSEYGD